MILSILIATIEERREQFEKLMAELRLGNGEHYKGVEVLALRDNRERSVGEKRQILLEEASGDYVAFFDDDDWPSPDYIPEILKALESKPDCVGFNVHYTENGTKDRICRLSLNNKARELKDNTYYRFTNHVTPVKRSIALKAGFKDMRYGEDEDYSSRVVPLCKTEVFIDKELYNYRYSDK